MALDPVLGHTAEPTACSLQVQFWSWEIGQKHIKSQCNGPWWPPWFPLGISQTQTAPCMHTLYAALTEHTFHGSLSTILPIYISLMNYLFICEYTLPIITGLLVPSLKPTLSQLERL